MPTRCRPVTARRPCTCSSSTRSGALGRPQATRSRSTRPGPTGSVSINGGAAYTNSANVTLTLSAIDAGSGVPRCSSPTTAPVGTTSLPTRRAMTTRCRRRRHEDRLRASTSTRPANVDAAQRHDHARHDRPDRRDRDQRRCGLRELPERHANAMSPARPRCASLNDGTLDTEIFEPYTARGGPGRYRGRRPEDASVAEYRKTRQATSSRQATRISHSTPIDPDRHDCDRPARDQRAAT